MCWVFRQRAIRDPGKKKEPKKKKNRKTGSGKKVDGGSKINGTVGEGRMKSEVCLEGE